jgi:hypothetical protein
MYPNSAALVARAKLRTLAATEQKAGAADSTRALGDSRKPQSAEAIAIERRFGAKQRNRVSKLDPMILKMFEAGEINPSLIYFAADRPELFALVENYKSDRGQRVIRSMANDFARVRAAAERNGARVIVLSTPYVAYASEHDCQNMTRFGYTCESGMYSSDAADSSTEAAGALSKIPVYEVTRSFREQAARRQLFYHYDDHPNRDGYQVLGDLFTPIVESVLAARSR